MKKIQIVKYKDEIINGELKDYYTQHKDKVYVFLGEFEHASGHCLLCEFGDEWKLSGMHHIADLEFLENHPDDFIVTIPFDED